MFHLTPDMLVATYCLLVTTPPFRGWHLPPADEIEFRAVPRRDCYGSYQQRTDGVHVITIDTNDVTNLAMLLQTMAHEIVHLAVDMANPSDQSHHGRRFRAAAKRVCRAHGWDLATF